MICLFLMCLAIFIAQHCSAFGFQMKMGSVQASWISGFNVKDRLVNRIIGFDKVLANLIT